MNELEIYHILCLEENTEIQKQIRKQFEGFKNIKITMTNGEVDCRFLMNNLAVDFVIANLDNDNIDIITYVKKLESLSSISPPILFHSQDGSWAHSQALTQFDCFYFIDRPFGEQTLLSVTRELLPDLDENYREVMAA